MSDQSGHDTLYADPLGRIDGFSFNEDVVRVFPDMIRRSVPGYNTIINQCGLLARKYAHNHSRIYDLGCSLGATTFAVSRAIQVQDCQVIAVDNSTAMIRRCQELLNELPPGAEVKLVESDIADIDIDNASVVILNFTLQFVAPNQRQQLMHKIYQGLIPGGILILSEKIRFEHEDQQRLHTEMYHAFKRANGYSDLEISQKRSALEKVLISDSIPEHKERLRTAGFSSSEIWFQCFNFASMIALK